MKTVDRTDRSASPKCNYCGATNPANGFAVKAVIHRGHDGRRQVVQESRFTVCKDTPCGAYLQMGYEG
jgi:hypothetical protein